MKVVELTQSLTCTEAIYPKGYVCRLATEEEVVKYFTEKLGQSLKVGSILVYLNGRLRVIDKGHYRIISK